MLDVRFLDYHFYICTDNFAALFSTVLYRVLSKTFLCFLIWCLLFFQLPSKHLIHLWTNFALDSNNPSDLIKQLRKDRETGRIFQGEVSETPLPRLKRKKGDEDEEWLEFTNEQLAENMKAEHGLALKSAVLNNMRAEEHIVVSFLIIIYHFIWKSFVWIGYWSWEFLETWWFAIGRGRTDVFFEEPHWERETEVDEASFKGLFAELWLYFIFSFNWVYHFIACSSASGLIRSSYFFLSYIPYFSNMVFAERFLIKIKALTKMTRKERGERRRKRRRIRSVSIEMPISYSTSLKCVSLTELFLF